MLVWRRDESATGPPRVRPATAGWQNANAVRHAGFPGCTGKRWTVSGRASGAGWPTGGRGVLGGHGAFIPSRRNSTCGNFADFF
eukprot:1883892-Prymnesium_polylepis.2